MAPHSLLTAESEDTADIHRLPAEVPAVQADSYRPVAQLTQRQGHSAEVQKTTAEITHNHIILTSTYHHTIHFLLLISINIVIRLNINKDVL